MSDTNEIKGVPALMLASQADLTHAEMKQQVSVIVDLVDRGIVNPLQAVTQLTYLIKLAEGAKESIKDYVLEEAAKYNKADTIKVYGATVQVSQTSRYDYAACGDPSWNRLNKEKKEREEFLKKVKKPMGIADEETGGETITIHPPGRTTSDIVKIIFPYGT